MNPMGQDLPNDANGDVLRRMLADGADLSKPHDIDFFIAAPNEQAGSAIASAAEQQGFSVDLDKDEEAADWTVCCSRSMVPDHAAITQTEQQLDALARPLGGWIDGWGAFPVE
jgi:regulator of RNase E activity RraB